MGNESIKRLALGKVSLSRYGRLCSPGPDSSLVPRISILSLDQVCASPPQIVNEKQVELKRLPVIEE